MHGCRALKLELQRFSCSNTLSPVFITCAQGAAVAFTSLCEAVVSWRDIRHDGLLTKITRIMQMYKAKLVRCRRRVCGLSSGRPLSSRRGMIHAAMRTAILCWAMRGMAVKAAAAR